MTSGTVSIWFNAEDQVGAALFAINDVSNDLDLSQIGIGDATGDYVTYESV